VIVWELLAAMFYLSALAITEVSYLGSEIFFDDEIFHGTLAIIENSRYL